MSFQNFEKISFDVAPGKSLGPFLLGMSTSDCIFILQQYFMKTARNIEIIYDDLVSFKNLKEI